MLLLVARRELRVRHRTSRASWPALPTAPVDVAGAQVLFGTIARRWLPIILLISMVVAYIVAGGAFQPVEQMINEVEAITDGRSLHRRLPADGASDELGAARHSR